MKVKLTEAEKWLNKKPVPKPGPNSEWNMLNRAELVKRKKKKSL